jgi:hypothetical protein
MRPRVTIWCDVIRFSLHVQLRGGRATIADRKHEVTVIFSYIAGPLDALAQAVVDLLKGADRTEARWMESPGEFRWVFQWSTDGLIIHILYFTEMFSRQQDSAGTLLFTSECRLADFAGQVISALKRVQEEYNPEYEKFSPYGWSFPDRLYEELRRLQREHKRTKKFSDSSATSASSPKRESFNGP